MLVSIGGKLYNVANVRKKLFMCLKFYCPQPVLKSRVKKKKKTKKNGKDIQICMHSTIIFVPINVCGSNLRRSMFWMSYLIIQNTLKCISCASNVTAPKLYQDFMKIERNLRISPFSSSIPISWSQPKMWPVGQITMQNAI